MCKSAKTLLTECTEPLLRFCNNIALCLNDYEMVVFILAKIAQLNRCVAPMNVDGVPVDVDAVEA